jgi:hypothetical protein
MDEVLHETGRSATVEYNKGAVMILPPGATKGTGLLYALHELGYSPHNVVACGDAENDRSLFEMAELSVAVSNATPDIRDMADYVLPQANGAGIRHLIDMLTNGQLPPSKPRRERQLLVGHAPDGAPIHIQPRILLSSNFGIAGGSGSGKSWLAGLLIEELLRRNYQVCIIDPEGDYSGLRAFPHTVVLGGPDTHLPSIVDVVTLCEYSGISLIVDLSSCELAERGPYVLDLMQALINLRSRRGRPHWFLMDEVHGLCPPKGGPLTDLIVDDMQEGGYGFVSYRPSMIAPELLEKLDHLLLTPMIWEEEIRHLERLVPSFPVGFFNVESLRKLPKGDAYLCLGTEGHGESTPGLVRVRTARRTVPHVRHLHKYLRAPLPESKRFHFHAIGTRRGPRFAASLWEFREALAEVPTTTLEYHLEREDFERWLTEVLHDKELAHRLRKIRHRHIERQQLREALVTVVADRYEELESLI